jgi:hypothetical protein
LFIQYSVLVHHGKGPAKRLELAGRDPFVLFGL